MIVDQNSHSRFPVNHRTRFSTHSCQSVGAKRLFTTRPRRSSTIPVIEDNHCLLHDGLFGDQFADRPDEAELAYVDQQLGRPMTALEDAGELESTTIVIVGDHGESLGDHGERAQGDDSL